MSEPLVVCLGYPELDKADHIERVRGIDPGIEVVTLPVEADKDWIRVSPAAPHPEPPPWAAMSVASRSATRST